jgi:hypothetical protein
LPSSLRHSQSLGAANLRQGHEVSPAPPVLQVPSGRRDLKGHRARRELLALRAVPVSVAKLAHPARRDWSGRRARKARRVHRGRQALPANAARLERKAPQVRLVQPEQLAKEETPAQRLPSVSSLAQTTCDAQTMSS